VQNLLLKTVLLYCSYLVRYQSFCAECANESFRAKYGNFSVGCYGIRVVECYGSRVVDCYGSRIVDCSGSRVVDCYDSMVVDAMAVGLWMLWQ
jgi:hypothetical protein